jgi:hypothetical protein
MEINYVAISITTIICVVLGMGWFGPVFGKAWAEIIGMPPASEMTPEQNKAFRQKMIPVYILNVIVTLIMMVILYLNVKGLTPVPGVTTAFLAWLGFVMPIEAGNALWSGKPKRHAWMMFLLTASYQLLCFVIAGALYTAL